MNYQELNELKTHLIEKIGFWMLDASRAKKVAEYRKELAKVEKKIAKELEGDLILN